MRGVNAGSMVDVVCYQMWRELMDTSDYPLKNQVSFWPRKDRALCMSLAAPSPLFHTDGAAFLARDLLCSCTWARSCPWSPRVSPTGPGFPPRAEDSCRGYWVCGAVLLLWGQELWFPWFRHMFALFQSLLCRFVMWEWVLPAALEMLYHMSQNEISDFTPGEASNWFKFSIERWKLFSEYFCVFSLPDGYFHKKIQEKLLLEK